MKHSFVSRFLAVLLAVLFACPLGALADPQADFYAYLTGGAPAHDGLRSLVTILDAQSAQDDIQVTINGIAYDGTYFAIGWTAENLQPESPAVIFFESVTVNGQEVETHFDFPTAHWLPNVFDGNPDHAQDMTYVAGMLGTISGEQPTGAMDIVLHARVFRPDAPIVVVDDTLHTLEDADEYLRNFAAVGIEVAPQDDLDVDAWVERGYAVLNMHGAYRAEDEEGYGEFLSDAVMRWDSQEAKAPTSGARQTAAFAVACTADASQARAHNLDITPAEDITLKDCTVHVRQALLTPMATTVELDIAPATEEMTYEDAVALFHAYATTELADASGDPLAYSPAGSVTTFGYSSPEEMPDGTWRLHVYGVYPGLEVLPDAIRVQPAPWSDHDVAQERIEAFGEAVRLSIPAASWQ